MSQIVLVIDGARVAPIGRLHAKVQSRSRPDCWHIVEMQEETDLVFSEKELEPLGIMDPSVGGCDEQIRLFRGMKVLPIAQIMEMHGKLTGVIEDGEVITVQVWKMADFINACRTSEIKDAKAKCLLFHHLLQKTI